MFLLPHSVGGTTLLRKLGTGGVAESYLGTQEGGRQVVVRRLLPFVLRDPARLASIEARILDLLGVRHPFLVHVLDHLTEGEEQYLVEEYVHGVTLEQVLTWCRQSGHIIPHNVFLNIATQICNGLEALHGRSGKGSSAEHVLHLSLKPSSIFLSTEGKVLVGGYGLTRSPTTFPQGGVAAPVPARMEYLSPEQTHPDQKLTPASDVFGLGAVLYELLTLESLFRAESNLQTIHRVRRAEVTAPLLKVKERMPGLDKVLFRALSLNPRHRYQRAFVLREDLRGLMAGYSFATISEDTRAFLQPILAGAATHATTGYVVGLDDAPEAPAGGDAFADSPNTRIDPDPMSTAAQAAASLAEKVARERAAESAVEHTERTDVSPEGELTPLPIAPPTLAPMPTPIPPMPTASPTWAPEADTLRELPPPAPEPLPLAIAEGPGGETTVSTSAPAALTTEQLEPPPTEASVAVAAPLIAARPSELPPSTSGAFVNPGRNKKRGKGASARSAFDPPTAEVARPASPTLSPAPSPFAAPSLDAPLPPMAAPALATPPTLAPEELDGGATRALPAPAPVYPPPLAEVPAPIPPAPPVEPATPPPPAASPRLATVPPPGGPAKGDRLAAVPPPARADAPPPPAPRATPAEDAFDEAPPPNRGPLFAGVVMAGLAAVLLCSGLGYWGYGRYSTAATELASVGGPATPPTETPAPPQVAPPEDDPAAVLAATNPADSKPAAPPEAKPAATPAPAAVEPPVAPKPEPVAKAEPPAPKPAPAPPPKPVAKAEPPAPKPAPKPVAKAEPKPAPKPAPEPKPAPKPVAKAEPKPAPAPKPAPTTSTSRTAAKPAPVEPDASLIVEEPTSPSLDGFVADAKSGRLTSDDVTTLEGTPSTDPQYTRSRALLLMNAQKKGDDAAVHKYLDQALSLPENQYNPVFLADYARWHVNRGEWDKALEKAGKAERYWARLPSELVFSKKTEIYEVEAAAWQGKFYKSGEDPELLENAVRAWERYRDHVSTKDRSDLVKKADEQITKLNDIRGRLQ